MSPVIAKDRLAGEVLLAFWKAHILHHAAQGPVYGLWLIEELKHHGYHVSPGTLYPLLRRMERYGWLKAERTHRKHTKQRIPYRITAAGIAALERIRLQAEKLHAELLARRLASEKSLRRRRRS